MSGRYFEPICGTIESVELAESADYYAMSYSWGMDADGDASLDRAINIDGRTKLITQNLYEGLLRFRDDAERRPLKIWVDAICINQGDNAERMQQVARMHHVYQYAKCTLVWLGEGASSADDAAANVVIRCAAQNMAGRSCAIAHGWAPDGRRIVNVCDWAPLRDIRLDCNNMTVVSPHEVIMLFSRRYFGRRWILQELFHARTRARAYWGSYNEELSVLRDAASMIIKRCGRDFGYQVSRSWPEIGPVQMIMKLLDQYVYSSVPGEIIQMLEACRNMSCADPRDRLYSLFSMVQDFDMVPDYDISITEVCISFARKLVDQGRLHWVLDCARLAHDSPFNKSTSRRTLNLALPSWVPDLALPLSSYNSPIWQCQDLSASTDNNGTLTIAPYVVGAIETPSPIEHFSASWNVAVDTTWRPVQSVGKSSAETASTSARMNHELAFDDFAAVVTDRTTLPVQLHSQQIQEKLASMTLLPKEDRSVVIIRFPHSSVVAELQEGDLCCLVSCVKVQDSDRLNVAAAEKSLHGDSLLFLRPLDAVKSTFSLMMLLEGLSECRITLINVEKPLKKHTLHIV